MPKALVNYVLYIESFNKGIAKWLSLAGIFALIAVLIIEAVLRSIFNVPTPWSMETSLFIMGSYFTIGGGYALLTDAHVRMDVFSIRWSPKRRAITDAVTFSLFATYIVVLIRGGFHNFAYSLRTGQHSASTWGPPLAPIKIIIVVGAVILLLQAIAFFIRDLAIIKGQEIA